MQGSCMHGSDAFVWAAGGKTVGWAGSEPETTSVQPSAIEQYVIVSLFGVDRCGGLGD